MTFPVGERLVRCAEASADRKRVKDQGVLFCWLPPLLGALARRVTATLTPVYSASAVATASQFGREHMLPRNSACEWLVR